MHNLIIFDCDGVLVDSEILAHQNDIESFEKIGYSINLEQSIQKFTGISQSYTQQTIYQETEIALSEDFFNQQQTKLLEKFKSSLKPLMRSVLLYLEKLNIKRCVASSSTAERVKYSLQLTQQYHFFKEESIFTASQVKNGKPSPDLFLLAAKKMGFEAKSCIVIEDSIAGIKAAQAAKMNVLAFLGGAHTRYDWYEKEIKSYHVPIAYNSKQVLKYLEGFLEQ